MYTDRDIRIGISAVRGIAKPHINLTQNRKKERLSREFTQFTQFGITVNFYGMIRSAAVLSGNGGQNEIWRARLKNGK